MSGVTFVFLSLPVEILFGEGGGGGVMRVGCSQLQQQIPTFSLCFWPCFAEWCFSFFFEGGWGGGGGGALTPLFGELKLFYDLGSLTDSCGLNLERKIG